MARACSYHAVVDATAEPVKVRVEATCTLKAADGSVHEPRGGVVRVEYTAPLSLPVTPCRPGVLPVPWPPYTPVDALIVVDTEPGLDLYGLEYRKSTVISTTKRTLLEGGPYLQLAEAERVVDEAAAVARGVAPGEAGYPLLTGLEWVDRLLRCEAEEGSGLRAWGRCLESLEPPRGWEEVLLPLSRSCPQRGYAALAERSGVDPHFIEAERPVRLARGWDGLAVAYSDIDGAAILVWKRGGVTEERRLKKGFNTLGFGVEGYSLHCRLCRLSL
ncbi:MAG: hypothetical protein GXO15_06195 [Crenarchaeota archaeon]|nr:hypothetical protein [Thermoproteota archaeon]